VVGRGQSHGPGLLGTPNSPPLPSSADVFPNDQLYIVVAAENAGIALEEYEVSDESCHQPPCCH